MADITLASVLANSGQTFREAALAQAFLQISENLKYMRHTSMLRGDDTSYMLKGNGEFIPYDPDGSAQDPGSILARTLTTYHAELLQEFDPENIYKTIFDKPLSASKITMPIVRAIVLQDMKNAASKMNYTIWSGVRNSSGTNSLANFDGFDTIIAKEKALGTPTISFELGNYMQLGQITPYNAGDKLKQLWMQANDMLKRANDQLFMIVPEAVKDMYLDWCTASQNQTLAGMYVDEFNGVYLHNSNKKCIIVSPPGADNLTHIILTSKKNLRLGSDGIGEGENATGSYLLRIPNNPRKVQLYTDCWMGVQFESVNKEYLMCGSFIGNTKSVFAQTDVESIAFGTVTSGQTKTKTITITGQNLTSSLIVNVIGGDGKVTVDKSVVTAQEAMADGGQAVVATFAPTAAGARLAPSSSPLPPTTSTSRSRSPAPAPNCQTL